MVKPVGSSHPKPELDFRVPVEPMCYFVQFLGALYFLHVDRKAGTVHRGISSDSPTNTNE
jgi:hypothetical protein